MSIRILHTSDWHAGKTNNKISRRDDLIYALDQFKKIVKEEKIDCIIVAGDIFDRTNPSSQDTEIIWDFFLEMNQLRVVSVLIGGNHDSQDFLKSMKGLLGLARVKVFDRIKNPKEVEKYTFAWDEKGEKLCFVAVPYPTPQILTSVWDDERKKSMEYSDNLHRYLESIKKFALEIYQGYIPILVSHLMVSGAKPANTEKEISIIEKYSIERERIPSEFMYVALGHIHECQEIEHTKNRMFYPGTPYQIDFGEADKEKYCLLVEIKGYKIEPKKIKLDIKRNLKVLEFDMQKFDLIKIREEIEKDKSSLKKVILKSSEISNIIKSEYISSIGSIEGVVSIHIENKREKSSFQSIIQDYKNEELNIIKLYEEYMSRKTNRERIEKIKEKLIEFMSTPQERSNETK